MLRNFQVIRIVIDTDQRSVEHQWGSRAMAIAECDEAAAVANDRGLCYQVEEWRPRAKRWEMIYSVNSAHAAACAMIQRGPIALEA